MELRPVPEGGRAAVLRRVASLGTEILNVDPHRHNLAGMGACLDRMGARLVEVRLEGDMVAVTAHVINPLNKNQAAVDIAVLAPSHGVAAAALHVNALADYLKVNSFLASGPADSDAIEIYRGVGFVDIGRMRSHRYRDHRYDDEYVLQFSPPLTTSRAADGQP